MKNIFSKNKKAFSLIELLVSLGIIIMITVIFMADYKTANKRTDMTMTAQKLVADIHLAQNNALGLVKYNGYVPAGGWGLSFDPTNNRYTLFADLDAPGNVGYMSYDPSLEGDINAGARVNNLSSNVIISSLKMSGNIATTTVTSANITFLPPDPKTNIYSNGATSTLLEIKIQDKNNVNSIKTIRVNFLGLAEVID